MKKEEKKNEILRKEGERERSKEKDLRLNEKIIIIIKKKVRPEGERKMKK
jgi:hypothetical protein